MRALLHLFGLVALLLTAHPAAAQKAYVREDLGSEVIRLEERIRKEAQPAGARTSADLRRVLRTIPNDNSADQAR